MPDLYNGTELWDLSMVDPDNRRRVDYELRGACSTQLESAVAGRSRRLHAGAAADWHDGRIKLAIIVTLLGHRRACPQLYSDGDYQPLPVLGPRTEEVCAYARSAGQQILIVAVARYARRREQQQQFGDETLVAVAEPLRRRRWRELLSGRTLLLEGEHFRAAELLHDLPAAVLAADEPGGS